MLAYAKTLRFVESGSLLALIHKWTRRTWFNAQEEIYLASREEVDQVRAAHPRIGRQIGPPCVVRNGLIARGVDGERVESEGVGERSPVATNDTVEGRERNRRTEVVLESCA